MKPSLISVSRLGHVARDPSLAVLGQPNPLWRKRCCRASFGGKTSKKNYAFNLECLHLAESFFGFGNDREERGMKKSTSPLAQETAPVYLFGGAALRGTRI